MLINVINFFLTYKVTKFVRLPILEGILFKLLPDNSLVIFIFYNNKIKYYLKNIVINFNYCLLYYKSY